jgi:hypothetical protein
MISLAALLTLLCTLAGGSSSAAFAPTTSKSMFMCPRRSHQVRMRITRDHSLIVAKKEADYNTIQQYAS